MKDEFKIYIDRLREGKEEQINLTISSEFIEIAEECPDPVHIFGVAYLADSYLILRLQIRTAFRSACAICNECFSFPLLIKDFYQAIELAKIPHFVFNFKDLVREEILLQIPYIIECNGGACPQRESLERYFSKNSHS